MARPREPIALVQAKGKKHLTKAEIEERTAVEVKPCTDDIVAPSYLSAAQKKTFDKLAAQLQKIQIMGETDCDTLARYVVAQDQYVQAAKDLKALRKLPKTQDPEALASWLEVADKFDKRVDRYFKQVQTAARDLGLTITSRCKLQVPVKDEAPKQNKFKQFEAVPGGNKGAAVNDG